MILNTGLYKRFISRKGGFITGNKPEVHEKTLKIMDSTKQFGYINLACAFGTVLLVKMLPVNGYYCKTII